ncbi:hypothetical protein AMTRI_Chr12g271570 [Amborella trichopoda]
MYCLLPSGFVTSSLILTPCFSPSSSLFFPHLQSVFHKVSRVGSNMNTAKLVLGSLPSWLEPINGYPYLTYLGANSSEKGAKGFVIDFLMGGESMLQCPRQLLVPLSM